jgi:hypothetical protein
VTGPPRVLAEVYRVFHQSLRPYFWIVSNDMMIVNNKLERIWKEGVVAYDIR